MITYQRTEEDEPQPIDDDGFLPDGAQVIFVSGEGDHVTRFGVGYFNMGDRTITPQPKLSGS